MSSPISSSPYDRIPLWNSSTGQLKTGFAAPMRKNLGRYLVQHPHYRVYTNKRERRRLAQVRTHNTRPSYAFLVPHQSFPARSFSGAEPAPRVALVLHDFQTTVPQSMAACAAAVIHPTTTLTDHDRPTSAPASHHCRPVAGWATNSCPSSIASPILVGAGSSDFSLWSEQGEDVRNIRVAAESSPGYAIGEPRWSHAQAEMDSLVDVGSIAESESVASGDGSMNLSFVHQQNPGCCDGCRAQRGSQQHSAVCCCGHNRTMVSPPQACCAHQWVAHCCPCRRSTTRHYRHPSASSEVFSTPLTDLHTQASAETEDDLSCFLRN